MNVPGRNDLCVCGSGAKYKRCCWKSDQFPERRRAQAERDAIMSRPKTAAERFEARQAVMLFLGAASFCVPPPRRG